MDLHSDNQQEKMTTGNTYRMFLKIHICYVLPVDNVIMRESMKR